VDRTDRTEGSVVRTDEFEEPDYKTMHQSKQ
jgi:hypothetical protein